MALVLTQRAGERIMIGNDVILTITRIRGSQVKLAFEAPKSTPILREKVLLKRAGQP